MRLRDIMPKSLFGRSLIILGLPIILLQIILTYFFFERHWQDVGRRLILSVAGEIAHISNQINQVYQEPQKINKIYVTDMTILVLVFNTRLLRHCLIILKLDLKKQD